MSSSMVVRFFSEVLLVKIKCAECTSLAFRDQACVNQETHIVGPFVLVHSIFNRKNSRLLGGPMD